jgi:hypothetical protein
MHRFDVTVASVARMYDYWLGGKDHFEADRQAAEAIIAIEPTAPLMAQANRAFLRRVVSYLAGEAGIRQFLDIGTGLPTMGGVHETAQAISPGSRVVYVDNDPVVLTHATALLNSTPEGHCAYVDADLRDTGKILQEAARTLDFGEPVAVLLFAILHFIPHSDDPYGVVRSLVEDLEHGSYLALSHVTPGKLTDDEFGQASTVYEGTNAGHLVQRSPEEVGRFFDGLAPVPPGVSDIMLWHPSPEEVWKPGRWVFYGGVGRVP